MLKNFKTSPLPIVLFIQAILIILIYLPFFTEGESVVFSDKYDGLKNYFVYYTYLLQGDDIPNTMFNQMNYPYYDYIFYPDLTPTLTIPLKWFSDNIVDITPYAFRIHNWFFLFGILLSTLLSWLIINRITKNIWLWSILAITLPWISPQLFRIEIGHFNLALSWCIIGTFYLIILIYDVRDNLKKIIGLSLIGLIWIYLVSFVHLYYLPMTCLIIGTFGLILAIWNRKNRKKLLGWLTWSAGLPMFGLLSVWATIRAIDQFYPLRKKVEDSYNWAEWNFKIDGFYSNYDFSSIPFLLKTNIELNQDSYAYLGTFTLYGFVFLLGWLIYKTIQHRSHFKIAFKTTFKTYFAGEKGAITLLVFFAGLMCLNVAIGEYAKLFNNMVSFDNPFHPFRYIRLLAGEATQFRVVARFNWVCFWAFNFVAIYLLDQFYDRHAQPWIRALIIVLAFSSIVNMIDMQVTASQAKFDNPFLAKAIVEPIDDLLENIETTQYQAVLPLPYYLLGSEVKDMMLTPQNDWEIATLVFSIQADLPLMASHFTRSPVIQHESLVSIFTKAGPNDYLKQHLNHQPILVFVSNDATHWTHESQNEKGNEYVQFGKQVIEKYDMKLLKTTDTWRLYEWNVN